MNQHSLTSMRLRVFIERVYIMKYELKRKQERYVEIFEEIIAGLAIFGNVLIVIFLILMYGESL